MFCQLQNLLERFLQQFPCSPIYSLPVILAPVVCICAGASVSVTLKWRIRKINFKRNGGKHLKRQGVKIFTEAELAKTTDSYDESKKLGEGGFGSVYRGRVVVDVEIVLKKAKDVHKPLMKNGFQDVLKIVTQTKHKKMVRLYGICLETRIPLLVYEYISNGTLSEHIHLNMSTILRSWENRLRIDAEAAFVLKEMHSSEIIHGNNKSVNILLDKNCSVKVSDFETSALISPEHIVATEIEGTLAYIDPEYLTTGKLTIKSDVYSFGVVLVELLTKRKLASSVADKSGEPINIIPYFISSVKDKSLFGVINFEAVSEDEIKQVEMLAKIAVKCLDQSSRKRPIMSEVARQLPPIHQSSPVAVEPNFEVPKTISPTVEIPVTHCLSCLGLDQGCSCI
ncbi:hypothetical protein ACJRO7_016907 [Eucalyptus globulus]|uniref:Protein kinase domain-containing protein n=1 Tax=Eucalyptus globulus TaxID=34317 RepID=A0ABD3KSS3_EUCGL